MWEVTISGKRNMLTPFSDREEAERFAQWKRDIARRVCMDVAGREPSVTYEVVPVVEG